MYLSCWLFVSFLLALAFALAVVAGDVRFGLLGRTLALQHTPWLPAVGLLETHR